MNELYRSADVAQTLRNGGKIDIGDIGHITATKRHTHIFDYDDMESCTGYRITKSKYVVVFTPSAKLRADLS